MCGGSCNTPPRRMGVGEFVRHELVGLYGLTEAEHLAVLTFVRDRAAQNQLPHNFRRHFRVCVELVARTMRGQETVRWLLDRLTNHGAAEVVRRRAEAVADDAAGLGDLYCALMDGSPPGGGERV